MCFYLFSNLDIQINIVCLTKSAEADTHVQRLFYLLFLRVCCVSTRWWHLVLW